MKVFIKVRPQIKMKRIYALLLLFSLPFGLLLQPVYSATEEIIVPEGTRIALQLNRSLSTKNDKEGDSFDAYVIEPVYHKERIAIPKGSVISGSISRISRPGRFKGKAVMHLLFRCIEIPGRGEISILASLEHIDSDEDADIYTEGTLQGKESTGSNIGKVVIPGLTGAGIGSLAGGRKGASIGTGIGIGVGLANIFWTRGKDLEIPRGATMDISLEQPLKIPLKPGGGE
jgi:hypothetical protein